MNLINLTLLRRGMVTVALFVVMLTSVGSGAFAHSGLGTDEQAGEQAAWPTSVTSGPLAAGFAPPAAASGVISDGGGPRRQVTVCQAAYQDASGRELLPVQRWSDSMSFHTRLGFKDVGDMVMRQGVMSMGMAAGNFFWETTTGLVQLSAAMCPLEKAGGAIDRAFASIGKAVLNSTLLTVLVVFSLLVYLFQMVRAQMGSQRSVANLLGGSDGSGSIVSKIFVKGISIALLVLMVNGALASTGGGAGGDSGPYRPGTLSPGWFVVTTDRVVSNVTSSVVNAAVGDSQVNAEMPGAKRGTPAYDPKSPYSCESYTKTMRQAYKNMVMVGGQGYEAAAALPLAVNSFWEKSGLVAWKEAQFGTDNTYGNIVYCRMLEANSDQPVYVRANKSDTPSDGSIAGLMKGFPNRPNSQGGPIAGVNWIDPNAYAWRSSTANVIRDRIYVALAACKHGGGRSYKNWDVPNDRKGLFPDNNGHGDPAEECNYVYADTNGDTRPSEAGGSSADGSEDGNRANGFDWESGGGKIDSATGLSEYDRDFLKNLHGVSTAKGMVVVMVYAFSALMIGLVFGLFALAVIFAKVLALVLMFGVLVALLQSLLPSAGLDRVGKYAKQYVGVSFFAFGASLLLAVVTLFTTVLINAGDGTLPRSGGIMPMLWTGVAPFLSILAIHYMFKKARIPSPISPMAASSYGKAAAAGSIGAAAGAASTNYLGQKSMARGLERAKGLSRDKVRSATAGLPGTRSKSDGAGKMGPGGALETAKKSKTGAGSGAGTAAAGLAAGAAAGAAMAGKKGAGSTPGAALADKHQERKAAKAWAGSKAGQDALAAQKAERDRYRGLAGKKREFADKGFSAMARDYTPAAGNRAKTAAKMAAVGTVAAATGGLGGAAIIGGAAALKYRSNIGRAVTGRPDAETINAYRTEQAREAQAKAKAEKARKETGAESRQAGGSGSSGKGPGTRGAETKPDTKPGSTQPGEKPSDGGAPGGPNAGQSGSKPPARGD